MIYDLLIACLTYAGIQRGSFKVIGLPADPSPGEHHHPAGNSPTILSFRLSIHGLPPGHTV
jgi:hypothetical protein